MKILKIIMLLLGMQLGLHATWKEYNQAEMKSAFGKYSVYKELKDSKGHAVVDPVSGAQVFTEEGIVGVRCLSKYNPEGGYDVSAKPILVTLVHGTWASQAAAYFANGTTTYDAVKDFAMHLAEAKKAPVFVMSYKWAGDNKHNARVAAGQTLADIFEKIFSKCSIVTIAHSHGGNVVNIASNYLDKSHIAIMAHIATPVIENTNKDYKPRNFDMLLDFYSTSDVVQFFGSIDSSRGMAHMISTVGSSRKFKKGKKNQGRIINIRTQIEGADTDHSTIKDILPALTTILTKIQHAYQVHNDLDMNIDMSQDDLNSKVLLAIRHKDSENPEALSEVDYSQYQKDIFKYLYNKEMDYKGNVFERMYNIAGNTLAMVKPFKQFQNFLRGKANNA